MNFTLQYFLQFIEIDGTKSTKACLECKGCIFLVKLKLKLCCCQIEKLKAPRLALFKLHDTQTLVFSNLLISGTVMIR